MVVTLFSSMRLITKYNKLFVYNSHHQKMKKIIQILCLSIVLSSGANAQSTEKKWTIQECVDYALANNISIKQTDLENKTAAVEKNAAIGAFLPTLNANTSHSWNIGLNQNITTGLLENQTTQFTSAGLSANIVIYNGLQNINRLRRANLSILSARYQLSKMKDDISLNVANSFLQILFNRENLKVQQNQLANNEKQLKRSQELVAAGTVPKGDLLDLQATIATNKQAIVVAENVLFLSKLSLAQLLQIKDFQTFDISYGDYPLTQSAAMLASPEAILEKARSERMELKIAKANLEIAQKDVIIAKGAYQPTLSGFYNFNTRASDNARVIGFAPDSAKPTSPIGFVQGTNQTVLQQNFVPVVSGALPIFDQFSNNKGNVFGLQLNIPILNGFTVKNNVARAKINVERSQITYSQQELTLQRNVYTAVSDAKGALNTYEAAKTSLEARKQAYNFAKDRFEAGLTNAFDLSQAQTLFVNAESEVIRTKFDYIFKIKIVEFYFGIQINKN